MLGCMGDGTKLKPMIIFKRKTFPKDKFPPRLVVKVQQKGWMTSELFTQWIDECWKERPGAMLGLRALLAMDTFKGHITEEAKSAMKEANTDIATIPGGMTSILQPLDVSINKTFKERLRQLYKQWLASTF